MKELNEVVFPFCLKILQEAQYIDWYWMYINIYTYLSIYKYN